MSGSHSHSHDGSSSHSHGDSLPPSPAGGLVRRLVPLLRLLGPHRRLLSIAVVSGIVNQTVIVASAYTGARLVGRAVTGTPARDLHGQFVWLLVLVLPLVASPWIETQLAHVAAFRVLVDIRAQVYGAFQRMSPGDLLHRRVGELGSTAISDVELLETFFAHTLSPLVTASVVPFGAVVALGTIDWRSALALLPALALVATVPTWLRARSEAQGTALRQRLGDLQAEAVDSLQGIREIVGFGAGARQQEKLRTAANALASVRRRHGRRAGIELGASDALVSLGVLCVLIVASRQVSTGGLNAADLAPMVILAAVALAPVVAVVDVARELQVVAAAADRVLALVAEPVSIVEPQHPRSVQGIHPDVAFRNVTFRYGPQLPDAVAGLSFTVAPGETVALVGQSGAGKSTTAHLLLRLWDVSDGSIAIGGVDIREMATTDLRRLVSFVSQDVYLFNISILDNLRLGRPDATQEQVEAAARTARAHDFISALPDGYDTIAGEHANALSGGQRQRLAVARALVADTPILVLDEAVSNLDAVTELELNEAMAAARVGRTTLVVAHRYSTIRTADRLVMMETGRVVEQGSLDELLARNAQFANLIAQQTS